MIVLLIGAVAGATLLLLILTFEAAHDRGIARLHAAGEPVPWWLPHSDCERCP